MLTLAHVGRAPAPHDLVWAWDPVVVLVGALVAVVHSRGARSGTASRRTAFLAGMAAVVLAVGSPVDALAERLVSIHMIQHLLLVTVGAPAIAWSRPWAALARGAPRWVPGLLRRSRRALGIDVQVLRLVRAPATRWLVYVTAFWVWHAAALYGAAVESTAIHILEHVMFLGAGLAVWNVILGRAAVDRGAALLGVFCLGIQSVLLAALLTFSQSPWYDTYVSSSAAWGVDPLADQRLAGVIMWVPGSLIHTAIGVALAVAWLSESSQSSVSSTAP